MKDSDCKHFKSLFLAETPPNITQLTLRWVLRALSICVQALWGPGTVLLPMVSPQRAEPLWFHPSLPVFHRAPQTSLSFICQQQQQPVIRIPLPAGPRRTGKQMWLGEAAGRLMFQLFLRARRRAHLPSDSAGHHGAPHTNSTCRI